MKRAALSLLILGLPMLAGCGAPGSLQLGRQDIAAALAHPIDVTYTGIAVHAWTEAPVEILDRYGTARTAVPLHMDGSGPPGTRQTFWLDGTGRVVRYDQGCPHSDTCTEAWISWEYRGMLPPLGIFWEAIETPDGSLLANAHDARSLLRLEARPDGFIEVTHEGATQDVFLNPGGTFRFDGSLAPSTILLVRSGSGLRLDRASLRQGTATWSVPEPWPEPEWTLHPATGGLPPGAETALPDWRQALSGFVEALQANATAAQQMSGGCLVAAALREPTDSPTDGPEPTRHEAASLVVQNASQATYWNVAWTGNATDGRWSVQPKSPAPLLDCASSAATIPWPDAYETARTWIPDNATNLAMAYEIANAQKKWNALATPTLYSMQFTDADAAGGFIGIPFQATLSAVDGQVEFLHMRPADLDAALARLARA